MDGFHTELAHVTAENNAMRAALAKKKWRTAVVNLSPKSPVGVTECDSVAYIGGDLPTLVVMVSGKVHNLVRGQCIPTKGKQVALFNPYSRRGKAEVIYNTEPTAMAAPPGDHELVQHEHRYFALAEAAANGGGGTTKNGFLAYVSAGKARVSFEIDSATSGQVIIVSDAAPGMMEAKPDNFLVRTRKLRNIQGEELTSVVAYDGNYSDWAIDQWVQNSGIDATRLRTIGSTRKMSFILTAGDGFVVSHLWADEFRASIEVWDLGDVPSDSYV